MKVLTSELTEGIYNVADAIVTQLIPGETVPPLESSTSKLVLDKKTLGALGNKTFSNLTLSGQSQQHVCVSVLPVNLGGKRLFVHPSNTPFTRVYMWQDYPDRDFFPV